MHGVNTDLRDWLKAYRLRAHLSYESLAYEMTAAGFPMRMRTLFRALNGASVLETTVYNMQQFRDQITRAEKAKAKRRLRRKAAKTAARADEGHVATS